MVIVTANSDKYNKMSPRKQCDKCKIDFGNCDKRKLYCEYCGTNLTIKGDEK